MHMGPLGVISYFVGSILWELVFDGGWGGTKDQNLSTLWEHIHSIYRSDRVSNRLTMLTFGMFAHGDSEFSFFIGKAGETLALMHVLFRMCSEMNTGSERDSHRLICLEALCYIFDQVKAHGQTIPLDVAELMLERCDEFLVHYNWLHKHHADNGRLHYHIVLKFHMLWHIVYHARF